MKLPAPRPSEVQLLCDSLLFPSISLKIAGQ